MSSNESNELSGNVPGEPTDNTSPGSGAEPTTEPSWSRRTFLRAAALGAAVTGAMLIDKDRAGRLHLGGAAALANDLSDYPCTANDIDVGTGTVVNEPCACTNTFNAQVAFPVTNRTSALRYCVTLHLPGGFGVPSQDVVLSTQSGSTTVPSNSTVMMFGQVVGFPCNPTGGVVCIGQPGTIRGKCDPGTCATIAFNTSAQSPCPDDSPPGGQCRHQQVCIQAFGASLTCVDNCTNRNPTNCNVGCGQTLSLLATASGASQGATAGTYSFNVTRPDGTHVTGSPITGTSPRCFTDATPQQGTYTLTVGDSAGCVRTATTSVSVQTVSPPTLTQQGTPDCNGNTTFTASPCPPVSGITYTLEQVNCSTGAFIGTLGNYNANTCTWTAQLTRGQTTCVRIRASNGNSACDVFSNMVQVVVPTSVTLAMGNPTQANCSGVVTLTATAGGGTGSYTFTFREGTTTITTGITGSGNSRTLTLQPQLNGQCRTITVSVVDSNNCPSTPANVKQSFSQCVVLTNDCAPE